MKFNPEKRFQGMVFREALRMQWTDSDGDLNVFNVESDEDGRHLETNNGHPDNEWNPENSFVFVRGNPQGFSPDANGSGEFCLTHRRLKRTLWVHL